MPRVDALDDDVDADLVRALLSCIRPVVQHVEVVPESTCRRHRYARQIPAVDRDARALVRHRRKPALLQVAPEFQLPEQQSLKRAGLSRVVRTHEHDRIAELDTASTNRLNRRMISRVSTGLAAYPDLSDT